MDRLFVTNIEDTEVLYKSARNREDVRTDPPCGKRLKNSALGDEQPSSETLD